LYNKFRVTMNMCEIGDEIYMEYTKFSWPLATCETKEGNKHIHIVTFNDISKCIVEIHGNLFIWEKPLVTLTNYKNLKLSSWDFVASSKHMI
jgi:hypothetical protein